MSSTISGISNDIASRPVPLASIVATISDLHAGTKGFAKKCSIDGSAKKVRAVSTNV